MADGEGGPATTARLSIVRDSIVEIVARATDAPIVPFDPSTSPWHGRAVFIVGAPRSGTTWLHQQLATHPDVASGGEMHVFCEGLAAVFANLEDPDPHMLLSTWVTRSELVGLARTFVDGIFTAGADRQREDAAMVLDKTPNHAHSAALMAEVFPDAHYVHIIRDPRDALSSARNLWGSWDATTRDFFVAAHGWRRTIEDCRTHLGPLRYHEVRYEDLLADPARGLTAIFEFVGLANDPSFVDDVVAFGKAPINVGPSNQRITARKYADIDQLDERAIVAVAGDLLVELGYVTAAERAEIASRHSWRDTARAGQDLVGRAARKGGRTARQARARLVESLSPQQRPRQVMDVTRRLVTSVEGGDDAALARLLSANVSAQRGEDPPRRGTADVTAFLHEILDGARATPVQADDKAATVDVVPSSGGRLSVTCFVRGGLIERVRAEGS